MKLTRNKLIIVGITVFLLLGTHFAYFGSRYLHRLRGLPINLMAVPAERRIILEKLRDSLVSYQEQYGKYPKTMNEWMGYDSAVEHLVRPPQYSRLGSYQVRLDLLPCKELFLVIQDPGVQYDGVVYEYEPEADDEIYFDGRYGLFNNLQIIYYGPDDVDIMNARTSCLEDD